MFLCVVSVSLDPSSLSFSSLRRSRLYRCSGLDRRAFDFLVLFRCGFCLRPSSSSFVSSFLRRYRRLRLGPRLFDITVAPLPPRAGLWDFAVDSRVWFGIWISRGVIAWFSWGLRAFLPREMVLFGDTYYFGIWNLDFGFLQTTALSSRDLGA
jgi:hypothetical protein